MSVDMLSFFNSIRDSFANRFTQHQVDGFNFILNHKLLSELKFSKIEVAYVLATVWHETAHTMQPIAEYGRGRGRAYGRPHKVTGKIYYGRGYVQLTHYDNYVKMSKQFNVDFVYNPDLVMQPEHAIHILLFGMKQGSFTGKSLFDYFGSTKADPVRARRIINGNDKADLIAGYYRIFLKALSNSTF